MTNLEKLHYAALTIGILAVIGCLIIWAQNSFGEENYGNFAQGCMYPPDYKGKITMEEFPKMSNVTVANFAMGIENIKGLTYLNPTVRTKFASLHLYNTKGIPYKCVPNSKGVIVCELGKKDTFKFVVYFIATSMFSACIGFFGCAIFAISKQSRRT